MPRQWLTVGVLLGLAVLTGWVLRTLDPTALFAREKPPHVPELYMENFVTTTMDLQGRPRRRVEADYMARYPDETSELENPYMVMYREEREPWHVRSERGWVSANGDVVLLLGKVNIWRNNAAGVREVDVHTTDLRVLPESDYGETEEPALIRTPTSESRGVGMRAYLDKSRLELLSQVHTYYDPNLQH